MTLLKSANYGGQQDKRLVFVPPPTGGAVAGLSHSLSLRFLITDERTKIPDNSRGRLQAVDNRNPRKWKMGVVKDQGEMLVKKQRKRQKRDSSFIFGPFSQLDIRQ